MRGCSLWSFGTRTCDSLTFEREKKKKIGLTMLIVRFIPFVFIFFRFAWSIFAFPFHRHTSLQVSCVAVRGQYVYTGSHDRTVRKWDLESMRCVACYTGHTDYVRSVAVDGRWVYSGSDDMSIRVWDPESEKVSLNWIFLKKKRKKKKKKKKNETTYALTPNMHLFSLCAVPLHATWSRGICPSPVCRWRPALFRLGRRHSPRLGSVQA